MKKLPGMVAYAVIKLDNLDNQSQVQGLEVVERTLLVLSLLPSLGLLGSGGVITLILLSSE